MGETQERRLDLHAAIDLSIENGVGYLLDAVEGPLEWGPSADALPGYAALQVFALVEGEVPVDHPVVAQGIAVMSGRIEGREVYSVSLRILAYDAILRQLEELRQSSSAKGSESEQMRYLTAMQEDVNWLVAAKPEGRGAWGYGAPKRVPGGIFYYDNSNTQCAVLALAVAAARGCKIPRSLWESVESHFLVDQDEEGPEVHDVPEFLRVKSISPPVRRTVVRNAATLYESVVAGEQLDVHARGWTYCRYDDAASRPDADPRRRSPVNGRTVDLQGDFPMTCAGLSSLLLARRYSGTPQRGGARNLAWRKSVRDGYGWLSRFFAEWADDGSPRRRLDQPTLVVDLWHSSYDLYSLAKVCDLASIKSFGAFDWYEELSRDLIRKQLPDGGWKMSSRMKPADIPFDRLRVPGWPRGGLGDVRPVEREELERRSETSFALLFLGRAADLVERELRDGWRPEEAANGSGTTTKVAAPPDRLSTWVYLPKEGVTVCLLALVRSHRHRPTPQLVTRLEEAAEVVEAEMLGSLVRMLSLTLSRSPHESARKDAARVLEKVTGIDGGSAERCMAWADEWDAVGTLAREASSEGVARLRQSLSTAAGSRLKERIVDAAVKARNRALIPLLIDALEEDDPALRQMAYDGLRKLSGESLPFDSTAEESVRREQTGAWRRWHESASSSSPHGD